MSAQDACRDDEQGKDRYIADDTNSACLACMSVIPIRTRPTTGEVVIGSAERFLFQFDRKLRDGRSNREFPKNRHGKVVQRFFSDQKGEEPVRGTHSEEPASAPRTAQARHEWSCQRSLEQRFRDSVVRVERLFGGWR